MKLFPPIRRELGRFVTWWISRSVPALVFERIISIEQGMYFVVPEEVPELTAGAHGEEWNLSWPRAVFENWEGALPKVAPKILVFSQRNSPLILRDRRDAGESMHLSECGIRGLAH
jgi:hypothetical protein